MLPVAAPQGSPWARLGAHLTSGQRGCSASLSAGRTMIGTAAKDIVLQGPGLAPEHCYIENVRGTLTLHPCGNACTIDGVTIQRPTRLTQGRAVDRSLLAAPGQDPAVLGTAVPSDSTRISGAILPLPVPHPQLLAGGVAHFRGCLRSRRKPPQDLLPMSARSRGPGYSDGPVWLEGLGPPRPATAPL